MNRFLRSPTRAGSLCTVLVAILFSATARTGCAARSEDSAEGALNLAALNTGAQIECTTPDGRVELLRPNEASQNSAALLRDQMLSCPLQQGVTTFVIKLPSTSLLDRFTFVNENAAAAGELKIAVSNYQLPAASPKWTEVDGSVAFSHKRLFNLSMLGVEARYVKLAFKVENGGRINALALYGGKSLDRATSYSKANYQFGWVDGAQEPRARKNEAEWDYASVRAKGRVVYVSSGQTPASSRMIDDSNETAYTFAATDRRPTAIVELSTNERIHHVTATYKTRTQGRFDVYLLEDISKSATDLNYRWPVASATDEDGDGLVEIDFNPEGARYIAVRFTPTEAFAADKVFEIIEINAYGDMPLAMLDLVEAPNVYSEMTAASFPGEGGPDISSKLGVVAIPPTLPIVSE